MRVSNRARSSRRIRASPPTRTTASRPRAPSRTSRSAACARPPISSPRPCSIKKAAAAANVALGRLDARVGDAIIQRRRRDPRRRAARSVRRRRLPGGRRHLAQHERQRGARQPRGRDARRRRAASTRAVHPNDHVNMGQSTNDVFPTATRLALLLGHARRWSTRRAALAASLAAARPTSSRTVLKVGRTHLQDAVPMTLGQEFGGYAACIERGADDVERASEQLKELNLGATAVGTGLNAGDDYTSSRSSQPRARASALDLAPAANRFRVTQSMGDVARVLGRDAAAGGGARRRSRATCGCSAWGHAPGSRRSSCPPCSPARRSCRAR